MFFHTSQIARIVQLQTSQDLIISCLPFFQNQDRIKTFTTSRHMYDLNLLHKVAQHKTHILMCKKADARQGGEYSACKTLPYSCTVIRGCSNLLLPFLDTFHTVLLPCLYIPSTLPLPRVMCNIDPLCPPFLPCSLQDPHTNVKGGEFS